MVPVPDDAKQGPVLLLVNYPTIRIERELCSPQFHGRGGMMFSPSWSAASEGSEGSKEAIDIIEYYLAESEGSLRIDPKGSAAC